MIYIYILVYQEKIYFIHLFLLQMQYTRLHPKGLLPVKFNDVLFSWHAVSMNLILILQCVYYERGEQRVSIPIVTLVSGLWLSICGGLVATVCNWMKWLKYLYFLSYIKVGTTPIKYAPQVNNTTLQTL